MWLSIFFPNGPDFSDFGPKSDLLDKMVRIGQNLGEITPKVTYFEHDFDCSERLNEVNTTTITGKVLFFSPLDHKTKE